jgi:hypothetical protein
MLVGMGTRFIDFRLFLYFFFFFGLGFFFGFESFYYFPFRTRLVVVALYQVVVCFVLLLTHIKIVSSSSSHPHHTRGIMFAIIKSLTSHVLVFFLRESGAGEVKKKIIFYSKKRCDRPI